jgi:hypothetical protein
MTIPPPSVKPEFGRLKLITYADSGELCPESLEERLFIDLWRQWRKLDDYTKVPYVLLLDFSGIGSVRMSTATDCLAAFASMIIGPDRPFYIACENVGKAVRPTLDLAFDRSSIVVAIETSKNSGVERVMIGDDKKKNDFDDGWQAIMRDAQAKKGGNLWNRGRPFEEENHLVRPPRVLEQMYLNGVLMRDRKSPSYRVLFPLSITDEIHNATTPRMPDG